MTAKGVDFCSTQGIWKSAGKIGKKCDFLSKKSVIFGKKCKKT